MFQLLTLVLVPALNVLVKLSFASFLTLHTLLVQFAHYTPCLLPSAQRSCSVSVKLLYVDKAEPAAACTGSLHGCVCSAV